MSRSFLSRLAAVPRFLYRSALGAPRGARALLALALLALAAGQLAAPLARWTSPELAVAAAYHRDAWLALRSADRLSLLADEVGRQDSGRDPWGERWRLGFHHAGAWPAGPIDTPGQVPLTKLYSVGPDGVDQQGGGDDVLVPARVARADFPLLAYASFAGLLKDGWLADLRLRLGPVYSSPRAVELLIFARPISWVVAALATLLGLLWWFAAGPRSTRAWVEVVRTLCLSLCLAVLGVLNFAALTWAWVPISTWIELHEASGSLLGFRLTFVLSLLLASGAGACALRAAAASAASEPNSERPPAARKALALAAVGVLALLISGGLSLRFASSEPVRFGRSRSAWVELLRSGGDEERMLALGALCELGPAAAPAAPEVVRFLKWSIGVGKAANFMTLGCSALAAMGEDALPLLEEEIRSSERVSYFRMYAISALSLMGPSAAPAVDELCALLEKEEAGYDEHPRAVRSLGAIGPAAAPATELLIRRAADDVVQRRLVVRALGRIGSPAGDAYLARSLDELLAPEGDFRKRPLLFQEILRAATELGPRGVALRERVPRLLAYCAEHELWFHPLVANAVLHLTGGDFDPVHVQPLLEGAAGLRQTGQWLLEARERYRR